MKQLQLIVIILLSAFNMAIAQVPPANDDCDGLIDLGVAPNCQTDVIYTNVDATASDIGVGNNPLCFNGGTVQNDVWFAFTTSDTIFDYSFTVQGVLNGPNGEPLENPQIALYRGDCQVNGLAELACVSAPNEQTLAQLDIFGLSINTTYFLRINDYSASATPNWGDFTLCVEEYIPALNIGDSEGSVSCSGTLYDSGGPDENYSDGEAFTFTICPQDFHECILIDLVDFGIENGWDFLNFYEGEDASGNLIASITGFSNGSDFQIQATSSCVTVEFTSDGIQNDSGFELTWQCTALACAGSEPIVIDAVPFNQDDFSTCETGASFAQTACANAQFLNGPETVFVYEAPGGACASIEVTNADLGTGVLVLDAPPADPNANCVATGEGGFIGSANFEEAGTYYIIVANGGGCTDFGLNIMEADCGISPTLEDALCNPLNGCVEVSGLPSVFIFDQGFQDMPIESGINAGCWLGVGFEPDFYWFTIEAQADGPFGFVLESAGLPSDIDFNVWGPFTPEEPCEDPDAVMDFIENNEPIRSSWAPSSISTGMVEVHPITGEIQTDAYDCGSLDTPGAGGDDFTAVIDAQEGEVYVVLVNDFGDQIAENGISVDWSASQEEVLAPIAPVVTAGDTAICPGDMAQLIVESTVDNITWLNNTESLSCTNCLDPIASPTETTIYKALISGVCVDTEIEIKVTVYGVDAGPDQTVCRNEDIQIISGANTTLGIYEWTVDNPGITLSCTDCPDPIVLAETAGTYTLTVSLEAPTCAFSDEMTLTVLDAEAPTFEARDSVSLCIGEDTDLMIDAPNTNAYIWTSDPVGFTSVEGNPTVQPTDTTIYYVAVSNGICLFPSTDSVYVEVAQPPVLNVAEDVAICLGASIVLGNTEIEEGVTYEWTGPGDIEDDTDPNSMATPQNSGTYTLTATRGACVVTASFNVQVTPVGIDINNGVDTVLICLGESVNLNALVIPANETATWTPAEGLSATTGNSIVASPTESTFYFANIVVPGCEESDTIFIQVDSLPTGLEILPQDTTICQGEVIELVSTTYEPGNFMNIDFMWSPGDGQQSPDSLYNLVVTPTDTTTYQRITTSGACIDTSTTTVNVIPPVVINVMPEDPELCEGESVDLTTSADEPLENYMWTPEMGLSCTDCEDPTASPSGTTNYMVTAETEGGACPAMGSVLITVLETPRLTPPTDTETCEGSGESFVLNLTPNPDFSYSWTSTDPAFAPTNDAAPVVTPTMTATYTVVMQNGDCEPVTDQVTINVLSSAILTVPESTTVCQGDDLTLTAEATQFGAFTWTNGGVEVSQDATFNPPTNQEGTTTYTVTFQNECETLTDMVTVTVLLAPQFTPPSIETLCASDAESVVLNENPNDIAYTYNWTSSDGTLNTMEAAPVVTPLMTTTYMVTVESENCPALEASFTIEVIENATLTVPEMQTVCQNDDLTITAEATQPGTFTWTTPGGTIISEDPSFDPPTENEGFVVYTVTFENECETLTDSVRVTTIGAILVDSLTCTPDLNPVPQGTEVTFAVFTSPSAADLNNPTYEWTSSDGTVFGTSQEASLLVTTEAEQESVMVTVTTANGCSVTTDKEFDVLPAAIEVPNIFTPNDDQTNDTFSAVVSGNIEIVAFRVYNRWGQLVFDDHTAANGWDGTFNGNLSPSDVYIYYIAYLRPGATEEEIASGDVTLVR